MSEFLVRIRDKTNPDPYLNVKCTKRFDVIVVSPDGWPWGSEELRHPDWRIVALPKVTVLQAQNFLSPEVDVDPTKPSRMLQRRGFYFDLASLTLPPALLAWVADDTRAQPIRSANYTAAQIATYKMARPPVPDPNVFP